MKKTLKIGAAGAVIALSMGMNSIAHAADDADATASVEVLRPLTLTNDAGLDFGAVAVNGSGTVAMAIDGFGAADLTCSTDIVCTGTSGLAGFTVSDGSGGRTVTVDLPSAGIDLVHTAPADPLAVDPATEVIELGSYVTDADEGTDIFGDPNGEYSVTLGGSGDPDEGEASFQVGGTLTFDGSEVAGTYEGTFNVSVEYS